MDCLWMFICPVWGKLWEIQFLPWPVVQERTTLKQLTHGMCTLLSVPLARQLESIGQNLPARI